MPDTWQRIGDNALVQAALHAFPGAMVGETRPITDIDWRGEHEGTEAEFQAKVDRNIACTRKALATAPQEARPALQRSLGYWQLMWALPRLRAALTGASEAEAGFIKSILGAYSRDRAGFRMSDRQAAFARSIIRDRKLFGVPSDEATIDDEPMLEDEA